jgi:hypothetical protein
MFVYAPKAPFSVVNSTFFYNSGFYGGGILWFNYYDVQGTVANSTLAGNEAFISGGGIFRTGYDAQGANYPGPDDLTLTSTVVAGNEKGTQPSSRGPDLVDKNGATGSFIVDHSFIGSTAGAAVSQSQPGTNKLDAGDPGLGPLADNGGPTETMMPTATSPLLDAGTPNGLTVDQRGKDRTADQPAPDAIGSQGADIGAAELADTQFVGGAASAKGKQRQKGRKIAVVVEVTSGEGGPVSVSASGLAKAGKKKVPLAGSGSLPAYGTSELTLRPTGKRGSKVLARALKRGKKAKTAIAVTFTDEAGNTATADAATKLVGKHKKHRKHG